MRNILQLSTLLVMVQALAACSSQKAQSGNASNITDASAPLIFANDWKLSVAAGNPGGMGSVDGLGADARFFLIKGVTRSGDKLYLSDTFNYAIREYDLNTTQVRTLAGHLGTLTSKSLDGLGTEAYFRNPVSIAALGQYIFVSDDGTSTEPAQLRSIELGTGNVLTINDPATNQPWNATGVASLRLTASSDSLYIARDEDIFSYDPQQGTFEHVIGVAGESDFVDGDATTARFGYISTISHDGSNGLFVMDNRDLRFLDLATRQVRTLAGSDHMTSDAGNIIGYIGLADGIGENAQFESVLSISHYGSKTYMVDTPSMELYMEKGPLAYGYQFGRVRTYDSTTNAVGTLAGYLPRATSIAGEADGPADSARFIYPRSVYADGNDIYVGSYASLRRVSATTGEVDTLAGSLITSPLYRPSALTLVDGLLYTFSRTQLEVMSIDPESGALSTVIGYHHDKFRTNICSPIAAARGNMYCASDYYDPLAGKGERQVYSVNLSTSDVSTVTPLGGLNIADMASDGDSLMLLRLSSSGKTILSKFDTRQDDSVQDVGKFLPANPYTSGYARLALLDGAAYITDATQVIRLDLTTGETQRIAGSDSEEGCSEGIADQARFTQLTGIAAGPGGMFVADGMCHTFSFVSLDTGKVTQLAGSPSNLVFKLGQGSDAGINWPSRVVYDSSRQSLYVADSFDHVIGKLTPPQR